MNTSGSITSALVAGLCLTSAAQVMASAPPDSDISMWVQAALRHDHHVDPAGIAVKTDRGVVTLSGSVHSLATKERALDDAKTIDGVIGLIDELHVIAPWRPDADITLDVRHRIIHNQMLESRLLGVASNEGTVTLTGSVGSWAEVQEAGILAAEVRGVHALENKLTVEYVGLRTDGEIKKEVQSKLDLDVFLNGLPITVAVKSGVVTLTGTVGSHFERDRAGREIRYLSHVKHLDNKLKVERSEDRGARTTAPAMPSDKELARNVKAVIGMDARIKPSRLAVRADSGHVTLTGSVPFSFQKRMAEQDARNTMGAAWVTNELLVTAVHRGDAALRLDVLSHFDSDYLLSGMGVTAQVKDGRVTLNGAVNNKAEQAHAEELVTKIVGVKQIKNNIKVERSQVSDSALTREVRKRLSRNWLTTGVQHYITVKASEGTVTLTGEVGNWSEREEARRVALHTAGVWSVHNKISVRGAAYPWDEWDDKVVFSSPYYWVWYW